jgi:hypothetical protein
MPKPSRSKYTQGQAVNGKGGKTIHRVVAGENFTTLPNSLLQDKALSFRARGLLAMMLSMPDNWQTYHSWITEQGQEGEEALRTAVRELEAAGYVTREQLREHGKVCGFLWKWHTSPIPVGERTKFRVSTKAQKTSSGLASTGKSATTKYTGNKVPKVQRTQPKGTEPDGSEDSACASDADVREEKLRFLTMPPHPSEEEFDGFLDEECLEQIKTRRDNLYAELRDRRWHQWMPRLRRWVLIKDWMAYVRALDETIEQSLTSKTNRQNRPF